MHNARLGGQNRQATIQTQLKLKIVNSSECMPARCTWRSQAPAFEPRADATKDNDSSNMLMHEVCEHSCHLISLCKTPTTPGPRFHSRMSSSAELHRELSISPWMYVRIHLLSRHISMQRSFKQLKAVRLPLGLQHLLTSLAFFDSHELLVERQPGC